MSYKFTCSFVLTVFPEFSKFKFYGKTKLHEIKTEDENCICEEMDFVNWSFDFDCDIVDHFQDTDEFRKLEPGEYYVFQTGVMSSGGYSTNWEYGTEDFEGWIFEPEYTKITKISETGIKE